MNVFFLFCFNNFAFCWNPIPDQKKTCWCINWSFERREATPLFIIDTGWPKMVHSYIYRLLFSVRTSVHLCMLSVVSRSVGLSVMISLKSRKLHYHALIEAFGWLWFNFLNFSWIFKWFLLSALLYMNMFLEIIMR